MKIIYNCDENYYICDYEDQNIHSFFLEKSTLFKTIIYERVRDLFKNDSSCEEKNVIKIGVTKQHIILKNKNIIYKLGHETFLNNFNSIKNIILENVNKCSKCENITNIYYISGNLEKHCIKCKCWCDSLKTKKYCIKNKNICYMCIQDILNIEL